MIDIHCHIIPGVDDGSDSIEESIKMARLAYNNGTKLIAATPHCNHVRSYENYWNEALYKRFIELRNALLSNKIPIKIFSGQEILFTNSTIELIKQNKLIPLNNSRYFLVEFEFTEHSVSVLRKIKQMISEGLVPIIAHPERYYFVDEDFNILYKLKDMGALLQVNKGSISGGFGRNAMINAEHIIRNRIADVVASDAHSPYMRTTNMSHAHEEISIITSMDYAELIFNKNPELILSDKEIFLY